MSKGDTLPLDLTWQPDGHATEIALSMVADGEHALLADGVLVHVEECDACSGRLGAAALMSLRVTEELPAIAARVAAAEALPIALPIARPIAKPIARPLPIGAIAAALVVAVIGAIPSLMKGLPKVPDFILSVARMLPVIGRSLVTFIQGAVSGTAGVAPALTWLSAALFLIAGLALARTMSRRHSLQGEMG